MIGINQIEAAQEAKKKKIMYYHSQQWQSFQIKGIRFRKLNSYTMDPISKLKTEPVMLKFATYKPFKKKEELFTSN